MVTSFKTIKHTAEGLLKEKGSKFYSFAIPASSEDEVKKQLELLRKKYHDASHHCYAYVLGADKSLHRANDDGEPNHSAGDPIMGQIRSRDLTNVLIVVVRYFGGTKLGVGGLIQSYKLAADLALQNATLIEVEIRAHFQLNFSYQQTAEVMRLLKSFDAEITKQNFTSDCNMQIALSINQVNQWEEKIDLLNKTGHHITMHELK
jgi:uncharacterized YigZ family protein